MATSERIEALVSAARCSVSTLQRHACYGRWQGWGGGTPCCVDELVDALEDASRHLTTGMRREESRALLSHTNRSDGWIPVIWPASSAPAEEVCH